MAHNESIKTFDTISKHFEMQEKRLKSLNPSSVPFATKGSKLKCKRAYCSSRLRKVHVLLKIPNPKVILPKSKRLNAMEKIT